MYICKIQYFIKIFFKFIRFPSIDFYACHDSMGILEIFTNVTVYFIWAGRIRVNILLFTRRGLPIDMENWRGKEDGRAKPMNASKIEHTDQYLKWLAVMRVCFKRQRYGQSWAMSWGITEVGYMSGCWDRERNREWKRKQARETEEEGTQVSVGNSSLLP